jgi:hypothetical protein
MRLLFLVSLFLFVTLIMVIHGKQIPKADSNATSIASTNKEDITDQQASSYDTSPYSDVREPRRRNRYYFKKK